MSILVLCSSKQECCDYGSTSTWEWLHSIEDPNDELAIIEALCEQCNLDPDYGYSFEVIHVDKRGEKYTSDKLNRRMKHIEEQAEKAHLARLEKKFGDFTEEEEKAELKRLKKKYD